MEIRKNINDSHIGPVQLLAISFQPNAEFEGKIIDELQRLEEMNYIRVLDLLFVRKDSDGSGLIALDIQGDELGAIVGALLGFEFEKDTQQKEQKAHIASSFSYGLSPQDVENIGTTLQPGITAGIVLIEHLWARNLKNVIKSSGGTPIAEGFLTSDALSSISNEILQTSEAIDKFEQEMVNRQPVRHIH